MGTEKYFKMNGSDCNGINDEGPGNTIILEPPELITAWTMDQKDLPKSNFSDLDNLFNEEYSNILLVNEDNLRRLKEKSLSDQFAIKKEFEEHTHQTVLDFNDISRVLTDTNYEEDKTDITSTNATSKITSARVSKVSVSKKLNDEKPNTQSFESSTKNEIESIDFSCQKCELADLNCKACISKTKKMRNIIVNTMKKTFPRINHGFIKIFVINAIFEKTRIV